MRTLLLFALYSLPVWAQAQTGLDAVIVNPVDGGGQSYSLSIQVLAFMTMLTVLPAMLLMMTSFTRVIIVLAILRQAIGTAQTPSNQILLGISLFITIFIMSPVFNEVYQTALQPYFEEQISADSALELAAKPVKSFMLAQTREDDLALFMQMSNTQPVAEPEQIPFPVLLPSFVTSELKTAFQIGFLIFIPFLIIDLVVASVLMSMGMMMLSPLIISLPFKLLLFVLVDGWAMIIGSLSASFF